MQDETEYLDAARQTQVQGEVTRLLGQMKQGDKAAWRDVYTLLYQDLRGQARRYTWRDRGITYSPTVLVHETWLRLQEDNLQAVNRVQLFSIMAKAMRCTLIDGLRRRWSEKRGGKGETVELDDAEDLAWKEGAELLIALDASLEELDELHPRLAKVVEWRYFGGYTETEIAGLLGVTDRTVRRDWQAARHFLMQRLASEAG